ncbi:hypothetical protein ACW5WQ_18410 [Aeromonas rivuli]|jgi:hypothetical protein|uniref:hypothetical protein n=1 Tax=Aeromonas TaxID=642 RepID=UPI0005A9A9D6|nr:MULTISPECIES: hypothetical protein [Aeromonas]MCS3461281.1 hypothetical protein [Aeromonas sp. BIGb0445]UBO73455.1 hypothetical protein KYK33_16790 [Aeromonas rivuli]
MANKTFNIDSFPAGYYMSWFVTTQAAFLIKAKLYDGNKVYFDKQKQSVDINPPLAQGADFVQGGQVKLSIDIAQSVKLSSSINTYNITTNDGTVIGYGYNISIEDQDDDDYNDVAISLVAWKNKG